MIYRFDTYSLDPDRLELRDNETLVTVEPQVFALLSFLLENRDRVVTKDEIIDAVWDGRVVSDGTLNSRINAARRAVGDDGKEQKIIKTFPRKGFRFVTELKNDEDTIRARASSGPISEKPAIAVLPFHNLSDDPEQEYFSDGITEDIITALSRMRWFRVIARNSAFAFKEKSMDVRKVADELEVRYVVEGSVRKMGNRIRLSAQLVDGAAGDHIWAHSYDRELEDIFDLQDELTQTIVAAIEPELSRAERERGRWNRSQNINAWDAYQRGMWHYHKRTEQDYLEAERYLREAIQLDENLELAYSGLADTLCMQAILGFSDSAADLFAEAITLAQRSVDIDGQNPLSRSALGRAYYLSRQNEKAIPECEMAIELNPSSAHSQYQLGAAVMYTGEFEQAIDKIGIAIGLGRHDPYIGHYYARMAEAHLLLGKYDEAANWASRALRQPGAIWPMAMLLASALGHLGRTSEASHAVEELFLLNPNFSEQIVRNNWPNPRSEWQDHILDGLRKAGWSEQ